MKAHASRRASILPLGSSLAASLFIFGAASVLALDLKVVNQDPPAQLDPAIRAQLQKKSIQLLAAGDKAVYEFWLCSEQPLISKPASPGKGLDALKQSVLMGAIRVYSPQRDYRDDALPAGVYTLRFTLQPTDGNHLGTSEFPYFAALTLAKLDPRPDGIPDYKTLVKLSSKETPGEHPLILSLRPVSSESGEFPQLAEPAPEHKSVRIKVPASAGAEKTSLAFEIVYEGKGHK